MDSRKVTNIVQAANKAYQNLIKNLKSIGTQQRINQSLSQIKISLDEMNKLSSQLKSKEDTQPETKKPETKETPENLPDKVKLEESAENNLMVNLENEDPFAGEKKQRGPYRQYTQEMKDNVIQLYKRGVSFNRISLTLNIPSKNIVRWCRNGTQRKPGAGRKVLDPQMEVMLNNWLTSKFGIGSCVNPDQVRAKAIQFSKVKQFEASLGWFKNFIRRHQLKGKYKFHS